MSILNSPEIIYKRWTDNKALHVRKTPLGVSGILLNLLIDHFAHNSMQFKYSHNEVGSRILVNLHQQWNPSNCENYPGVYVKRQEWAPRIEGRVIGDYKNFDTPDGVEYWVPITTTYAIICVGKDSGEIETLLNEVGVYFLVFSNPMRKYLDFSNIDLTGISPVSLIHEAKEYRSGQVSLSLSFDFVWKLTSELPYLKNVKVQ